MPNPNPKTEYLRPYPKVGDRPLARKVVGTRYPEEVLAALRSLPSDEMQALIRSAVEERLKAIGLLE